jgi:hypothetical protein
MYFNVNFPIYGKIFSDWDKANEHLDNTNKIDK